MKKAHLLGDEDLMLQIAGELRERRDGGDQPAVADAALAGVRRLHVREEHGAGVQRQGAQPAGLTEEVLRGALPKRDGREAGHVCNMDVPIYPNTCI